MPPQEPACGFIYETNNRQLHYMNPYIMHVKRKKNIHVTIVFIFRTYLTEMKIYTGIYMKNKFILIIQVLLPGVINKRAKTKS